MKAFVLEVNLYKHAARLDRTKRKIYTRTSEHVLVMLVAEIHVIIVQACVRGMCIRNHIRTTEPKNRIIAAR
jgi:hypothetical protein